MTRRPNIVFLLADDLGYGDFSAFNNGLSSTPTLDRVARLSHALDQWFEDVERDRRSITDTVPPPRTPRPWSGT